MAVRLFILAAVLAGCSLFPSEQMQKIVLLAPFEGRYREIGYDALYAANLALADNERSTIELLAIDDGGSIDSAIERAGAIRHDATIVGAVLLGPYASHEAVQQALEPLETLIVGHWSVQPSAENVYQLASNELNTTIEIEEGIDIVDMLQKPGALLGSEVLALEQVPLLIQDLSRITVISSASMPDTAFVERYLSSNQFAPEPGLLSTLTYDATAMMLQAISNKTPLSDILYEGINGRIRFVDGYWADAPIYSYRYDESGELVPLS